MQTWFLPQGLDVRQGFWQRSSMQAILTGQSRSTRHSGSGSASMGDVQNAYPSPCKGGRQVQTSLCPLASHLAPSAQGPGEQRGRQFWESLSQRSLSLQSECSLQPTGVQLTYGLPWRPFAQEHLAYRCMKMLLHEIKVWVRSKLPGGNQHCTGHWCHTFGLGMGQYSAQSGRLYPKDNPHCAGTHLWMDVRR